MSKHQVPLSMITRQLRQWFFALSPSLADCQPNKMSKDGMINYKKVMPARHAMLYGRVAAQLLSYVWRLERGCLCLWSTWTAHSTRRAASARCTVCWSSERAAKEQAPCLVVLHDLDALLSFRSEPSAETVRAAQIGQRLLRHL